MTLRLEDLLPTRRAATVIAAALIIAISWSSSRPAQAEDPPSPSDDQPLVFEDAYPTERGQAELKLTGRYDRTHDGDDVWEAVPRLKVGLLKDLDLSISVPYSFAEGPGNDDGALALGFQYLLTEERGFLHALAIELGGAAPLGKREGTETSVTLLATKSLTGSKSGPGVHLNLSWRHIFSGGPTDRDDRYVAVLGYSHPVGANTTLVADLLRERGRTKGEESNVVGAGFRHRLNDTFTLSAGGGVGIADESPEFRLVIGLEASTTLF